MARIIFGIILLVSFLSQLANQGLSSGMPTSLDSSEEMAGYYAGKILIFVLAIWLIQSGVKKRNERKEAAMTSVEGEKTQNQEVAANTKGI